MIKNLISKYTSPLLLLSVIAIGGYIWFLQNQIHTLETGITTLQNNNSKLMDSVNMQKETIDVINSRYQEISSRYQVLNRNVSGLERDQNRIRAQYNEYRDRLKQLSKENPEAIEHITNRAIDELMRKFAESSGSENETNRESRDNSAR